MEKLKKTIYINDILFILIFAFRSITDGIYVSKNIDSLFVNIKYVIMIISILLMLSQLKNKDNFKFFKETKNCIISVLLLFIISMILVFVKGNFYQSILDHTLKMIIPPVYVFLYINTSNFERIYKCMKYILYFSIIGYILELGFSNITFDSFKLIDYSNSYSPFESSYAAGISIILFLFFRYYKDNRVLLLLSFIFNLLTFKRIAIVYSIAMLIIPMFVDIDKNIKLGTKRIIPVVFIIMTLIYYNLLLPDNAELFFRLFNVDLNTFTMSRNVLFSRLLDSGYTMNGLGTTYYYINHLLEMDLIRILVETSVIGLIVFVVGYWKVCSRNLYCILVYMYVFINLLLSHSIYNSFDWIILFITLATIKYYSKNGLNHINTDN